MHHAHLHTHSKQPIHQADEALLWPEATQSPGNGRRAVYSPSCQKCLKAPDRYVMRAHDSNTSLEQRLAESSQTSKRHFPYVPQCYLLLRSISSVITIKNRALSQAALMCTI